MPRTFSLAPERLVPLGEKRFALIVAESDPKAGHSEPGAIAIAYLRNDVGGWTLEQAWPEIAYAGNFGKPNYKSAVKHFGQRILYLATSKYCGMGGCEDDINIIDLDHERPQFLGSIAGDSVFPISPDPYTSCETYKYKVRVDPPLTKTDLMSVTYIGWTAPAGKTQPKRSFRVTADAAFVKDHLELRPRIKIPDCGK